MGLSLETTSCRRDGDCFCDFERLTLPVVAFLLESRSNVVRGGLSRARGKSIVYFPICCVEAAIQSILLLVIKSIISLSSLQLHTQGTESARIGGLKNVRGLRRIGVSFGKVAQEREVRV